MPTGSALENVFITGAKLKTKKKSFCSSSHLVKLCCAATRRMEPRGRRPRCVLLCTQSHVQAPLHATPPHSTPRYATLPNATPPNATPPNATAPHAMPCRGLRGTRKHSKGLSWNFYCSQADYCSANHEKNKACLASSSYRTTSSLREFMFSWVSHVTSGVCFWRSLT